MDHRDLKRKIDFFDDFEYCEKSDDERDESFRESVDALRVCHQSERTNCSGMRQTSPRAREKGIEYHGSRARIRQGGGKSTGLSKKPIENSIESPHASNQSTSMPESSTEASSRLESAPSTDATSKHVLKQGEMALENRKRTGKRQALKMVPEAQRIFRGLIILFIPNDDIAPARRMRIRKSLEYGSTWVKEWQDNVSHIVADNNITMADVAKFLKRPDVPSGVVVVNESYISDCISWRSLVDPSLGRYLVKGDGAVTSTKPPIATSSTPSNSLQPPRAPEVIQSVESSLWQSTSREECEIFKGRDAMEQAIAQVKRVKHLPLDSDEEEEETDDCNISDASDALENRQDVNVTLSEDYQPQTATWQMKFTCMQHHHGCETKQNPNSKTIEILQEMEKYYAAANDQWRSRAYRLAISTLRKQTIHIIAKEEAERLPNVGARLAEKIEEIATRNSLRRLESAKSETSDQVLQTFMKIYGVGLAQASIWVEEGHRTIEDLLKNVELTPNQRIGIEHYKDFCLRIPRSETAQLSDIVRRALLHIDKEFQMVVGGSYRRGSQDSGDIDLLITREGASASYLWAVIIETLVPQLQDRGFLTAALAATSRDTGSKWHGACQLPQNPDNLKDSPSNPQKNPNPWRRIDLLLVPWDEFGAAILYFTGNDIFNRSMRLLARRKGMRLNQRGLYKDVLRDRGQQKLTQGTKIEGHSERRIFEALGVPWREPEARNC